MRDVIYVTLPVHNEEHTIGVLMWKIRKVFADLDRDFRILVADDASTDGTADVLEPYRRVLPLTVFRNATRQGYSASLEALIREAVRRSRYPKRDAVLVMQADFTDGPEMIPEMLRRFQGGADLVAGREVDTREAPPSVRLARLGAGMITRPAALADLDEDPFCGFRLYRLVALKRALKEVPGDARLLRYDGWAASMELLTAVAPHLRSSVQVDIATDYTRRYRTSRFRAFSTLWGLFRAARDPRFRGAVAGERGTRRTAESRV
jgi:glycosyltransferase involved in cell wall biosynthesis